MKTILGLSYIAALPVAVTVILYLLNKRTAFGKLSEKTKQIIYGIIFGGLAVIATEFGVDVGGAAANTRDAAVLTASLVFGAPAGIIAGFIGGIERFLAVYWGAGTYTRVACSISTIIAGLFGAALRKYMFDNKKPSVSYALAIGIVTEVLHMLMIFVTNMSDIATAFVFVKKCSIPMISVNAIAVMFSVLFVTLLGKERNGHKKGAAKQISTVAQQWLLICVVIAFSLTCAFTSALQIQISNTDTDELLRLNIEDIVADITSASDRNLLTLTERVASEYTENTNLDKIAIKYNAAEINIIDKDGIIVDSTFRNFLGFDMASGEQSAEFLVLLHGQDSFVQDYRPISYNKTKHMKYAGVTLPEGGFIQVGYDAKHFQEDINREIINATANRHVGQNGYIIIADEKGRIVSGENAGKFMGEIGFILMDNIKTGTRFTTDVSGEKSQCMYLVKEGYYVISVLPENEAVFTRDLSIYMIVFMEIVIFVGLFILTYFLIKKLVVDNIKSVNNSLAEITGGNLNVTVNVRSNEEFASLSDDINATVDTLKQYIAEAAARIDRELELAKVIQESSLPPAKDPFPDRKDFSIFANMNTAKEVGGDFYDYYFIDENHLAFLVADVSGKGVTGAMFMMKAKTIIKSFAEQSTDAAEILTKANNALCEGNDAEMFVTCFICILDLQTGTCDFANAGHNPPLIRHGDGSFEFYKSRPGFVLGGMENIIYKKGQLDFNVGDTIFLYTDGVTEATDSNEELYGEERLHSILNSSDCKTPDDICLSVKADVERFVGDAPQFDDITMLCIKTEKPTDGKEVEKGE